MNSPTPLHPELRAYQEARVFALADVHTAVHIGRLGGETDERVVLALALAVRALRHGSVCVELDRLADIIADLDAGAREDDSGSAVADLPWPTPAELVTALRKSPLVTGTAPGGLRPLKLVDTASGVLLYLDRYYRQEQTMRAVLAERESSRPPVDIAQVAAVLGELFTDAGRPTAPPDRQRLAAALAATEWTTILTGGPGTGKTHTVARILALLHRLHGPGLRVALCAPTGKAASSLTEAVAGQAEAVGLPAAPVAVTLHRLLGARRSGNGFRFNDRNRLPYDVVVVDETSMVSLTLMAQLLSALLPKGRLLLIGDPDQLMSVEAGAVLADLVRRTADRSDNAALQQISAADLEVDAAGDEPPLDDQERVALVRGVVRLRRGRRFQSAIARLADAVRGGDVEATLAVLADGGDVTLAEPGDITAVRDSVVTAGTDLVNAALAGDAGAALSALTRHRLLCAHRQGPFGRAHWAAQALGWTAAALGRNPDLGGFYAGQPLLITGNDYDLGVFNGDIGVVLASGGGLVAAIERGAAPLLVEPTALAEAQTAYAMTIHRSQGSQYRSVSVILPGPESPLLTRQLLYTAITRAQQQVRIVGSAEAIAAAVTRQVRRASGLTSSTH
jgi:exodeoxyribonuclease V alpha subunit